VPAARDHEPEPSAQEHKEIAMTERMTGAQALAPMQYTFAAGQSYSVADEVRGEYDYSNTFDVSTHAIVAGKLKYYELQFGHRVYFVKAGDVVLKHVS
jgi:hypothetical protein